MAMQCAVCGSRSAAKLCGAGKAVAYCCLDCQKLHWAKHKPVCGPIVAAAAQCESTTGFGDQTGVRIEPERATQIADDNAVTAVLTDGLLGGHILRYFHPLRDFKAVAPICSQLSKLCDSDDLWYPVVNWSIEEVEEVESIEYRGTYRSGRVAVNHVFGALAANDTFYTYFRRGRCSRNEIEALMSGRHTVTHPGSVCLHGSSAIESWVRILGRPAGDLPVTCVRQRWQVDTSIATVTCGEDFGTNVVEATNIYEYCDGRWRMVHHHGSHAG